MDDEKLKKHAELFRKVGAKAREEKKRAEKIALSTALGFLCLILILAWATDGRVFLAPWNYVMSFEAAGDPPRAPGLNCSKQKNKNTPYCIKRRGRIESTWHGISRHHNGKASPFTLHGKK